MDGPVFSGTPTESVQIGFGPIWHTLIQTLPPVFFLLQFDTLALHEMINPSAEDCAKAFLIVLLVWI